MSTPASASDLVSASTDVRGRLVENLTRVVKLPSEAIEPLICGLAAGGHMLVEGIPGIGKTLLARTLAACIDGTFRRVQFTNDLMPSDVIGSSIWQQDTGTFRFIEGPLFANLVLADEINRTSPRTLSCLLEAMENGRVSVDGTSHELGRPFTVLATRNPIEFHGTFPVPEAALDRFLVRVELDYPDPQFELELYTGHDAEASLASIEPVMTPAELDALQRSVAAVAVAPPVAEYALRVVQATRAHPDVQLGASPRAALAWLKTARARALLDGRDFVLPDDLKQLARSTLAHRVFVRPGVDAFAIVDAAVDSVTVPL
ncbi:MAG: AAA family ATPase [Planctomycetota bacterium]